MLPIQENLRLRERVAPFSSRKGKNVVSEIPQREAQSHIIHYLERANDTVSGKDHPGWEDQQG